MLRYGLRDAHFANYNNLPMVEVASSTLSLRSSFPQLLRDFAILSARSGVAGEVAALLLHRHFSVESKQLILEQPVILRDGKKALAAKPEKTSDTGEAMPFRWHLTADNEFLPLEFTADRYSSGAVPLLATQSRFLKAYAAILNEYELSGLIGLCLAKTEHLTPTQNERLMEETYEDGSVVTVEPLSAISSDSIPTMWMPVVEMGCKVVNNCQSFCHPQEPPRIHQKTGHMPLPRHYPWS